MLWSYYSVKNIVMCVCVCVYIHTHTHTHTHPTAMMCGGRTYNLSTGSQSLNDYKFKASLGKMMIFILYLKIKNQIQN